MDTLMIVIVLLMTPAEDGTVEIRHKHSVENTTMARCKAFGDLVRSQVLKEPVVVLCLPYARNAKEV